MPLQPATSADATSSSSAHPGAIKESTTASRQDRLTVLWLLRVRMRLWASMRSPSYEKFRAGSRIGRASACNAHGDDAVHWT